MSELIKDRIKKIHATLAYRGLMDMKAELVTDFSNGRCQSMKDMQLSELTELLRHLNSGNEAPPTRGDRQRKRIISMAHQMGWQVDGQKADMKRINEWCVKYGKWHKPLNDHTTLELNELVTQFEIMYTKSMTHGQPESDS